MKDFVKIFEPLTRKFNTIQKVFIIGFEPTPRYSEQILNLSRLPIPPNKQN
jgi:hypothetical protein